MRARCRSLDHELDVTAVQCAAEPGNPNIRMAVDVSRDDTAEHGVLSYRVGTVVLVSRHWQCMPQPATGDSRAQRVHFDGLALSVRRVVERRALAGGAYRLVLDLWPVDALNACVLDAHVKMAQLYPPNTTEHEHLARLAERRRKRVDIDVDTFLGVQGSINYDEATNDARYNISWHPDYVVVAFGIDLHSAFLQFKLGFEVEFKGKTTWADGFDWEYRRVEFVGMLASSMDAHLDFGTFATNYLVEPVHLRLDLMSLYDSADESGGGGVLDPSALTDGATSLDIPLLKPFGQSVLDIELRIDLTFILRAGGHLTELELGAGWRFNLTRRIGFESHGTGDWRALLKDPNANAAKTHPRIYAKVGGELYAFAGIGPALSMEINVLGLGWLQEYFPSFSGRFPTQHFHLAAQAGVRTDGAVFSYDSYRKLGWNKSESGWAAGSVKVVPEVGISLWWWARRFANAAAGEKKWYVPEVSTGMEFKWLQKKFHSLAYTLTKGTGHHVDDHEWTPGLITVGDPERDPPISCYDLSTRMMGVGCAACVAASDVCGFCVTEGRCGVWNRDGSLRSTRAGLRCSVGAGNMTLARGRDRPCDPRLTVYAPLEFVDARKSKRAWYAGKRYAVRVSSVWPAVPRVSVYFRPSPMHPWMNEQVFDEGAEITYALPAFAPPGDEYQLRVLLNDGMDLPNAPVADSPTFSVVAPPACTEAGRCVSADTCEALGGVAEEVYFFQNNSCEAAGHAGVECCRQVVGHGQVITESFPPCPVCGEGAELFVKRRRYCVNQFVKALAMRNESVPRSVSTLDLCGKRGIGSSELIAEQVSFCPHTKPCPSSPLQVLSPDAEYDGDAGRLYRAGDVVSLEWAGGKLDSPVHAFALVAAPNTSDGCAWQHVTSSVGYSLNYKDWTVPESELLLGAGYHDGGHQFPLLLRTHTADGKMLESITSTLYASWLAEWSTSVSAGGDGVRTLDVLGGRANLRIGVPSKVGVTHSKREPYIGRVLGVALNAQPALPVGTVVTLTHAGVDWLDFTGTYEYTITVGDGDLASGTAYYNCTGVPSGGACARATDVQSMLRAVSAEKLSHPVHRCQVLPNDRLVQLPVLDTDALDGVSTYRQGAAGELDGSAGVAVLTTPAIIAIVAAAAVCCATLCACIACVLLKGDAGNRERQRDSLRHRTASEEMVTMRNLPYRSASRSTSRSRSASAATRSRGNSAASSSGTGSRRNSLSRTRRQPDNVIMRARTARYY